MGFATSERAALCALFDQVGPDAPTLCEGWDTGDLAAHLWVRENDPVGAPGILLAPLNGLTERRMTRVRERWSFPELVERLRQGPPTLSPFGIPAVDEAVNAAEFVVHHEDVRRAGNDPAGPRPLEPGLQDLLWGQLRLMGRNAFGSLDLGVVLERSDTGGDGLRLASGASTVTMIGTPCELALLTMGRGAVARVDQIGEPEALATLADAGFAAGHPAE